MKESEVVCQFRHTTSRVLSLITCTIASEAEYQRMHPDWT
jgi:hypothetical protein